MTVKTVSTARHLTQFQKAGIVDEAIRLNGSLAAPKKSRELITFAETSLKIRITDKVVRDVLAGNGTPKIRPGDTKGRPVRTASHTRHY